ncbi:hypothetical protein [Actinomadura livida]|uniref:DUF5642 domain-containing protein n=1 Tax=Actinomadura livida TaxID=79909 RepID=A0A7W7I7J0_9ACTN|nr:MULTISPECIES: hypothetical protein [Actinomadura]MBB4771971.1 hypothetical protein [Actinomadura catellatispora]GGU03770.1 hypothetical protein GCM10010208_29950 [Actinomadura livida]
MAHRLLPIMLLSTAAAATACGGGGERARPVHGTAPAEVAGVGYTSDQLAQALLTDVPGYRKAGEPDSGSYGTLRPIQNAARLQRQAVLDKPQCATSGPNGTVPADVPAALVTFAKSGQTVTQTMMGMPVGAAEKQVNARVPAGCLRFRTKVGSQWAQHRVAESPKGDIGEGSRTVGVATVSGDTGTRTWYVVFRGRHYLATITVSGPTATRTEAERLARTALNQADRILP